jgi:hypothetical protein
MPNTDEIESGLLPTPFTNEGSVIALKRHITNRDEWKGMSYRAGAKQHERLWPTPHGMSPDGKSNGPSGNELGQAVNQSLYPTPNATKTLNGGVADRVNQINQQVSGSLNPTWVEGLMGFPYGWTDVSGEK